MSDSINFKTGRARAAAAILVGLTAGCAVGPDYKRPDAGAPAAFKEAAAGWKMASPSDAAPRGPWWQAYGDPILGSLESQVEASNQSLKASLANYEAARQLARSDRTALLPSVSADASASRSKLPASALAGPASNGGKTSNQYVAELQAAWEPDIWGRIRRQTESDVATAQSLAADYASTRLSTEALLAQDYIQLRILDEKQRLLSDSVDAYRRTVSISENKYKVGVAARSDVITAQTQLDATRAQLIDVGVQRAQLEHAIAVLVGKMPAGFSIEPEQEIALAVPAIPSILPSELLERRPDVAQAERLAAAANAKIGIQEAAYFPSLSLTGTAGFEGNSLSHLFTAPYELWSLGAQASDALLDWGQRHDLVLQAKAAYEGSIANYRQTALTAFQQVEDNLSNLRILAEESEVEDVAVAEAVQATKISLNEYNAGTVDFATVASAEVTELTSKETALTIRQSRLLASIGLIQALGGGWSEAELPTTGKVYSGH